MAKLVRKKSGVSLSFGRRILFSVSRTSGRRLMAMLDNSEIRFLPLGARRVAYELRGDGPPLVAPAWWVSHLELDWQSTDFRRFWEGVADGYTLIRYDRLGVGMSDRTMHESDLTIDEEVATLRALLDELELERVTPPLRRRPKSATACTRRPGFSCGERKVSRSAGLRPRRVPTPSRVAVDQREGSCRSSICAAHRHY